VRLDQVAPYGAVLDPELVHKRIAHLLFCKGLSRFRDCSLGALVLERSVKYRGKKKKLI
jgi:hypothetical protein